MSRTTLREDGLVVVDDVLPEDVFRLLSEEVAYGDYRCVHSQKWNKAWRLWDGHPLRGESIYFDPQQTCGWQGTIYPTSTSVDMLIDAVRQVSVIYPDIVGEEGIDWLALYLSPWLYPVGSALSLHKDSDRYTGAFTFFAHSRWSTHWGGELIVSRSKSMISTSISTVQRETFEPVGSGRNPWMSEDASPIDDTGIATCILPKPNRLVLIGPDCPHRIARVDQNAGAQIRTSIAGFFLRSLQRSIR